MSVILGLLTALRRRLGAEDGVIILWALGAMAIVLALSGAALAAVTGDTSGTASDTNQKQAYAAAEAGIQRYLFELNTNNTYWTQCVPSGANWIVNTNASEVGHQQAVPGSSTETYAVMLLPAVGQTTYTSCSTADPVDSMIQASGANAGTLRISSTGSAGNAQRTVVAAVRQQNFLDYTYFTSRETSDPYVQVADAYNSSSTNSVTRAQDTPIEPPLQCAAAGNPTGCGSSWQDAIDGATSQCSLTRAAGRENAPFYSNTYGGYSNGSGASSLSAYCSNIQFIASDQINGPFHSNDSVLMCGSPSFGQSPHNDSVEFGGDKSVYPTGYTETSGCSGSPTIHGTLTAQDASLNIPKIGGLASVADYTYTGTTCVNLTASYVQVAQPTASQSCATSTNLSYTNLTYASFNNGVLYDNAGACAASYDVEYTPYTGNTGCGTVYVKGVDAAPLTIGAETDIVIDGNLTYANSSALLGLIATGFIRVYHPVTGGVCTANGASNLSGFTPITQISAAMLSLTHSFIVDNYACGNNLGTLTVNGAIAQNFRGTVGSGSAGYTKNYVYDRRLQYEEPPHFLAPTNGAFAIAFQTECESAAICNATS